MIYLEAVEIGDAALTRQLIASTTLDLNQSGYVRVSKNTLQTIDIYYLERTYCINIRGVYGLQ